MSHVISPYSPCQSLLALTLVSYYSVLSLSYLSLPAVLWASCSQHPCAWSDDCWSDSEKGKSKLKSNSGSHSVHDYHMTWKCFPHHWPFVQETTCYWGFSMQRASDVKLWFFSSLSVWTSCWTTVDLLVTSFKWIAISMAITLYSAVIMQSIFSKYSQKAPHSSSLGCHLWVSGPIYVIAYNLIVCNLMKYWIA